MVRASTALGVVCCLVAASHAGTDVATPANTVQYFTEAFLPTLVNSPTKELSNIVYRPYMVSVRIKPHWYRKSQYCDSAVVGDRWVVTSARCCSRGCGTPYSPQHVRLRSQSSSLESGGVEHHVERIHVMDGYDVKSIHNNLCLIEVKGNFSFGERLKALQLADDFDYTEDSFGKISGWTTPGGSHTSQLWTRGMPLISTAACQQLYAARGHAASDITDHLFCVATDFTGEHVCHGDGGSPLVLNGKLAGVVTTGGGCGNNPGIFTNVNKHRDWIIRFIGASEFDIDIRSNFTL